MYGIHNVRVSAMVQIVQFTNQGPVHELALVVRGRIEVTKKQVLVTHGNGLRSGPVTETDAIDNFLCKCGLRKLMTWSSPRCPLRNYYVVHSNNNFYFVGIGPILYVELTCIFSLYIVSKIGLITIR